MDRERQDATGVALRDAYAWADLAELARSARELGYGTLFLPEVGSRDTLAAITGLAGEVDAPMRLGTGVVPLPARPVRLLAIAAATAQERAGGRLLLGVGTGPAVPGALDRLREVVLALREAFATGEAAFDGERVRLDLRPPTPPPIWIAALGPRAVRLAAEVADGVLLNWCTPERVAEAVASIRAAAGEAGRDPAAVEVGVYVRAALAPGSEEPLRAAAAEYGSYPGYARQFRAMGIDPGDPDAIAGAVCLRGDHAAARDRLAAYREAGADLPVVYPIIRQRTAERAPDPEEALETLRTLAP